MDGGHVHRAGIGESADSEALGFGPRSPFYSGTENANETTYGGITGPEREYDGLFRSLCPCLVDDLAITKNPVRDLLLQARPLPPAPPPSTSSEDLGKTSTPLANPTLDGRRSSPPSPSLWHRFSRMCPGRCTRCPWCLMSRLPKSRVCTGHGFVLRLMTSGCSR